MIIGMLLAIIAFPIIAGVLMLIIIIKILLTGKL